MKTNNFVYNITMRPKEVISKYGRCIELISMDPFFNEVTIGLFFQRTLNYCLFI